MEIPRVFKFPHDLKEIGTGWAIQNLSEYGNSVIPDRLLEIMDEKTLKKLLEAILDSEVVIYHTKNGYIAERI